MEMKELYYFIAIARRVRSFQKAAERLFMASPALASF